MIFGIWQVPGRVRYISSAWRSLGMQRCYLYSIPARGSAVRMCLAGWRACDLRESVLGCQTLLRSASYRRKRLRVVCWVLHWGGAEKIRGADVRDADSWAAGQSLGIWRCWGLNPFFGPAQIICHAASAGKRRPKILLVCCVFRCHTQARERLTLSAGHCTNLTLKIVLSAWATCRKG